MFHVTMADYTREDARHFICTAEVEPIDGKDIHYAIADDNGDYLGTISLKSVDLVSSNAEYAINLRKCAQGKGIAAWATKEILRIAFEEFGFHRVYLNVLSDNQKAIRLYEKCGFVYEGTFRNHLLLRGEYKSLRWYSMLKEEYIPDNFGGGNEKQHIINIVCSFSNTWACYFTSFHVREVAK